MKITLLFCALILPTLALASDPLTQTEKDHFSALGGEVLRRSQNYYGQTDLLKNVDSALLPMEAQTDVAYHNEEVELGTFRDPVTIEFDRSSGRLTSFFNVALANQPNPLTDTPQKVAWSKEQVQAKAQRFVVAVLGKMPEEVGKEAVVEFTPKVLFAADKSKKYQLGTWRVVWYRQNKQGVRFQYDTLIVQMIDGAEPLSLGYNFWSSNPDNAVASISPDKAVALAKAQTTAIMGWPPGAMWLKNHTLVNTPKWELRIVNPNHLLSQSQMGGMGDAAARLAWVVTFPKTYTGPQKPGSATPIGGYLEVWIDAANGQFLGGDFQ